jgi:hypothetical protein
MEVSSPGSPLASSSAFADDDVRVCEGSSFSDSDDSSVTDGVAELGANPMSERRSDKFISPLKYTSNASS